MEGTSRHRSHIFYFSSGLISELVGIIRKEYGKVVDEDEAQDIGTKIAKFVLAKECGDYAQAI